VAECQTCGRSFDERAYQVIVWGLGSFDSVECAEKALWRKRRRVRAAEGFVPAASDAATRATPSRSPLESAEEP